MTFENITSAYATYKCLPTKAIEARAQAINADIAGDPNADIAAYGIELEALERILEERQTETRAQVPQGIGRTAAGTDTDDDRAGTPEYRSAFYKHLQGRTLTGAEQAAFEAVNAERRGSEFNTLSNAAAIIPTTTLDQILVKARDMGGIMGIARAFNMPANLAVPVATPGPAAQWHTAGATVDTEKADPAKVTFGAYEIMKILSISAATRTMSINAFEAYLSDELSASVMACLAKGMVDGTGEGEATGILTGITWKDADTASASDRINQVTVAADATLGFADILDAIALLHRGYAGGARFVMNNRTLYQDVYGLTDEVNRPLYVQDVAEAGKGRIMGFDVALDDFMPDHEILFGNFRFYGYNLPAGIALDVSRESSFAKGLVDYRALAIADAKPIVADAFVRIAKATE